MGSHSRKVSPRFKGEGTHPRTEHTQWEERQGHTVRAYRMGEIVVAAWENTPFLLVMGYTLKPGDLPVLPQDGQHSSHSHLSPLFLL